MLEKSHRKEGVTRLHISPTSSVFVLSHSHQREDCHRMFLALGGSSVEAVGSAWDLKPEEGSSPLERTRQTCHYW